MLLLGAGEMAEAAARSLSKGARAVRICNRSFDRARGPRGGDARVGRARGTSSSRSSCTADVVVASTASRTPVVTRDMVKRAMKARKGRTLFFVDIAVPRNVEPAVHGIDNVYVYNVDDLEKEVARGLEGRAQRARGGRGDRRATRWSSSSPGRAVSRCSRRWSRCAPRTRAVLFAELERSLGSRLKHLAEGDRAALRR